MRSLSTLASLILTLSALAVARDGSQRDPQYTADFNAAAGMGMGSGGSAAGLGSDNDTVAAEDTHGYAANLTETAERTEWATAHADESKWGYTIYRTYYPPDDPDEVAWTTAFETLQTIVRASLAADAEFDGHDRDPANIKDRVAFDIVADPPHLAGASYDDVRTHFQGFVKNEYNGTKLGGFNMGGYMKLRLPGAAHDGMAINQALVVDEDAMNSLLAYDPEQEAFDFDAGEAPPYVVAVDACYDPATFTPSTSWTAAYAGWYNVPAQLLMLDFYDAAYERRPMEYFAPHEGAPANMFGVAFLGDDGEPEDIEPLSREEYLAEAAKQREALIDNRAQKVVE